MNWKFFWPMEFEMSKEESDFVFIKLIKYMKNIIY